MVGDLSWLPDPHPATLSIPLNRTGGENKLGNKTDAGLVPAGGQVSGLGGSGRPGRQTPQRERPPILLLCISFTAEHRAMPVKKKLFHTCPQSNCPHTIK